MTRYKERYLVDESGKRIGVFLDIADYQKLLEELEELESIRAFDNAKAADDEVIGFEDAIVEMSEHPNKLQSIYPSNLKYGFSTRR